MFLFCAGKIRLLCEMAAALSTVARLVDLLDSNFLC